MEIDLSNESIFKDNKLEINKKCCYIFGKNGTGKSTVAKIIKEKFLEYDVRIFQGFESVISENKELNAVILGQENIEIDKKVNEIENEIKKIKNKVTEEEKLIDNENINNLFGMKEESYKNYKRQEDLIEKFHSTEASRIKNIIPQIANVNYNKNSFKQEIEKANKLDDETKEKLKKSLSLEQKIAKNIEFPKINLQEKLSIINKLLQKKVKEKIVLQRLDNNDKKNFAMTGLQIHKKGDICSFCGNTISDECFEKLERYFSEKDIDEFKCEINREYDSINNAKEYLEKINIDSSMFYDKNLYKILKIKSKFLDIKNENLEFLNNLSNKILEKKTNLFESMNTIDIEIPKNFLNIELEFNKLVKENNSINLMEEQEKNKELLRFDEIKNSLTKFGYYEKIENIKKLKIIYEEDSKKYNDKKMEIEELNKEIEKLNLKKRELISQSKNVEILANEINKILNCYVNFCLVYNKVGHAGIYSIKPNFPQNYSIQASVV